MRNWKHLILAMVLIFLSAGIAKAQQFTGRVTDKTGAMIPNVTITVHNNGTNVNLRTVTTSSGSYTIPYLTPGSYTVTAEAPGFEKSVHTGIVLQVGQTSTVNFAMQVGGGSVTVTVNADTLLDLQKADIGAVVENTRVTELPLNGRDPYMLSILNAGVIWTGSIQWQRPFDDTQENLSINGSWSGYNEVMLDRISNEAAATNNTGNSKVAYSAPVDSVQEFRIITNPYDALYGRTMGGVIDSTLKSGTNKLHGDMYEFARRTWLDANTWQNNWIIARAIGTDNEASYRQTYAREQHKLDQYGAELDGPVRLPWLYNGKDKTFFLLQYENWNEKVPNSLITSVPDSKWASGDFSNLTWWNGSDNAYEPVWIYDPLSIQQNSSGQWVRKTFAEEAGHPGDAAYNIIPTSRLNKTSQKVMTYFPAPNTTPASGTNPFANNYVTPNPTTDRYRNVLGKIDENLTDRDRFFVRYGYWERVEIRNTNGMSGPIASGQLPHGERAHSVMLAETHTFTPNLLLDFRATGAARADYTFNGPSGYDPTELGWSQSLVDQMGPSGRSQFPRIEFSEFAYIGHQGGSQTVSNSLAMLPDLTWIKGSHTFHAGVDVRFMQSANDRVGGGPYWWEDRQWSQNHYNYWDNASGNSFASFMLGDMTSGHVDVYTTTFWSQHYWAPFIQDDWKVTKKLTLNLGVRWDFNPSMTERNNYGDYAFDTTSVNPIDAEVDHSLLPGGKQILGGVTFLGVGKNPRHPYALTKTAIQPRFGFTYGLNPETVLRGGFAELYINPQAGPNSLGYNYSTSFSASLDGNKTPNATIDNPYPSGITQPPGSSLGLRTDLGQGPWYLNPKYHTPSIWTFSLGFERSFLKNNTINVDYVGSRGFNLDKSDNINHYPVDQMTPCNLEEGGDPNVCDNNYVTNPFKGISGFEGSNYYSADTIQSINLYRPYPQFGDVTVYQTNQGKTWYNSLQVSGVRKWSNSLTLHGTWTWSKMMQSGGYADTNYRVPSRTLDGNDRTHRVTVSGVYVLPLGRGKKLFGNANRMVDTAIGGWELGALYVYETGWPWTTSYNYLHNAHVSRHIEKSTGYIRGVEPCVQQWDQENGTWSDKQLSYQYEGTCKQMDFQVVPSYASATNTVYTGIRVPSDQQFDANLSKNFAIYDRMKLQLRWEAFNVMNHPLWQSSYNDSAQDTNFGTIEKGPSGQSNLPRQMQIALKLMW